MVEVMKKIFLETFGCQMNLLDSELVQNQLATLGYTFTPQLDEAQVVLYNTCSVRELAEQKVWSRLGRIKERKAALSEAGMENLIVGVIGCMAERDGLSLLKRMPQVDLLCGPSELDQLPALLENAILTGRQQHALAGNTSRRTKTLDHAAETTDGLETLDLSRSFSPTEARYQAYIRIVRGCNKFCTYCVVPYTRGPEVSRSPQVILDEAKKLVAAGCLEITLLGQTVNHYVYESPTPTISTATGPVHARTTFAELLELLHEQLPDLPRLRFITSFPADFSLDILHVMARSPRICRYLHMPAQSGSNRILSLMKRGYTAESYLELLAQARQIVPNIAFAGDIIVGFPTETDEDYAATRRLLETARYKNCFIFKYSPRPGTLAIKRHPDDVPDEVKRQRNNDLLQIQNRVSMELNRELIGQEVEVLCEGLSGWKGTGNAESVIAAPLGSVHSSVELGPTLSGFMNAQAGSLAPTATLTTETPQLTGRTTSDQIVVFDGPSTLEGTIVRVRVREAHRMTIFADLVTDTSTDASENG